MEIKGIYDASTLDNIFWFILDGKDNAILIDPGSPKVILEFLESNKLLPDCILITHNHDDHVAGVGEITKKFHCPVIGPEDETLEFITQAFGEKETFERMGVKFEVLALPGHHPHHVGYLADKKHLFCGDVVMGAGCGNVTQNTYKEMHASLQKCKALPPSTKLYWGHEYTASNLLFASKVEPSNPDIVKRLDRSSKEIQENQFSAPGTLSEELKVNPFLRTDQPDVIAAASEHAGGKLKNSEEVFTALRKWKSAG